MKILYCHDNCYYKSPDGRVLSAGQFPYEYWQPFIDTFGGLSVAARGERLSPGFDVSGMNISSGPGVEFSLMSNMNSVAGLLKHKAHNAGYIKDLVARHDGLIIRAVSEIGWLAYGEAKRQNKPFAMEMSACAWDSTWNHGNLKGRIYAPFRMRHDRIITRDAHFVLYVSREFLPRRYPASGQVEFASNVRIHPVSQEILDQRLKRIQRISQGSEPFIIGLIGSLNHKIKGVADAIHAVSVLGRRIKRPVLLRHLGPGNIEKYQDLVRSLNLDGRVFFDGMLPSGNAVLNWLDGVDLYIQPSYQEGLPRAVIEAMSRGCPSAGSTAGGIPELLSADMLHRPGDYKSLAVIMQKIIEDPYMQIDMANRNFTMAKTYTSDVLMPRRHAFWNAFRDYVQSCPDKRPRG